MKLFLSLIFCVVFLLYEAMVFSLFFKVVTVITIWPYFGIKLLTIFLLIRYPNMS